MPIVAMGTSMASEQIRTEQRGGPRAPMTVEVTVVGRTRGFAATTVDLSPTGTLLWITDEAFLPSQAASDMVRFSERVAQELASTLVLKFSGGVSREADVVRVTRKGKDESNPMLLACHFCERLGAEELRAMASRPQQQQHAAHKPAQQTSRGASAGNGRRVQISTAGAPPTGVGERRTAPRVERILYAEVQGDQGTYRSYALNVSAVGALLTISDPQFAPPAEADQLVVFTKRMGLQFRNGMIVRFLEAEVSADADVVRVSERTEGGELLITIGVKFRRALNLQECARLEIAPGAAEAAAASGAAEGGPAGALTQAAPQKTKIIELMHQAVALGASDIHVKVGSPVRMRISGELMDTSKEIVSAQESHAMALELMLPSMAQKLHVDKDVEFAYNISGVGRFRCSAFQQRGTTGLAVRIIPDHVPTFDELGLPEVCRVLADRPRGLVLVTGPTGSGKSHTLAAMVDHINRTRACHILTMEDPIEFLHSDDRAHITQREIGRDCGDFATGLRRALRQDPDVILVGEMRDLETTSLALSAAETGHLVFATLHTTSAVNTPDRIIDIFPSNQQVQVRQQLSDSLQGVVSQLLVPRATQEGLALVQEIIVATEAIRSLIREGKTSQIRNIMQTSAKAGMQSLEAGLNGLIKTGEVSYETAVAKANYPKEIEPAHGRSRLDARR